MNAKVTRRFYDLQKDCIREEGEEFEVAKKRLLRLKALGLAEVAPVQLKKEKDKTVAE